MALIILKMLTIIIRMSVYLINLFLGEPQHKLAILPEPTPTLSIARPRVYSEAVLMAVGPVARVLTAVVPAEGAETVFCVGEVLTLINLGKNYLHNRNPLFGMVIRSMLKETIFGTAFIPFLDG